MTIKTSESLQQIYEAFKADAARARRYAENAIAQSGAGPITATDVLDLYERLERMEAHLSASLLITGLPAYAQTAESDPTYDLVAETSTAIAAIASTQTWIANNFPSNSGYLLAYTIVDGEIVPRSFSVVQTAGLRTALQAIVDAIGAQT